MPLRVLIIPDKFKGSLSAGRVAAAIGRGWRAVRPDDMITLLPMCDGGDGFGEVMASLLSARVRWVRTVDAAHRPIRARWWWVEKTRTAIIESAEVIGLARMQSPKSTVQSPKSTVHSPESTVQGPSSSDEATEDEKSKVQSPSAAAAVRKSKTAHPFELDTFGLGHVLSAAVEVGARRCLIGIGGSATNDGGFGLARALGWRFLGQGGREIEEWTNLCELEEICAPEGGPGQARGLPYFEELLVAADVTNPLLGQRGGTRIYGPQKGLQVRDFVRAEACLARLAAKVEERQRYGLTRHSTLDTQRRDGRWQMVDRRWQMADLSRVRGAGAAGGLGFGLLAFAGGRIVRGFELFAGEAGLEERLREADVVITGEGSIDDSTFMGKGLGEVMKRCTELGVPCIGLTGNMRLKPEGRDPKSEIRNPKAESKAFKGERRRVRLDELKELIKSTELIELNELDRPGLGGFTAVGCLAQITTEEEAKGRPKFWLERLARKVAGAVREART